MKKNNVAKNIMLHIRYPWAACCLLIMWVGVALMCAILKFGVDEIITLVSVAGAATLVIALVGFRA